MTRLLLVATTAFIVMAATTPALVRFSHAVVPIIVAVGAVVLIVRGAWHFTRRW